MSLFPRPMRKHPAATLFIVCFLVIALLVIRNLYGPEKDSRLTTIRRAGYPVTLAELNAFYPRVPDDENAALIYQRAFQLESFTNSIFDDLTQDLEMIRGKALPEEFRSDLAAALATNASAWQLLYSATNFSGSRYPLDMREGYLTPLSHLAKIKRAATLLSIEGLSHASAGESNEAYAAFSAALQAGDSLKNEPILISFLVRIACSALVAKRVEHALNLVAFQDGQLRSLQQRFAAADDPRWAARCLAGERAFGLAFFIDRHIQRSIIFPQQQQGMGGLPKGLAGQLAIAAYRASGLMARDQDFYLDAMGRNVARAELTAHERVAAGPPPSMIPTNRFLIFSRMILPALQRALDRANEHAARMRVVESGLAVERFRIAHSGALPDNLEQLAPQYLRAVSLDPFDGKPLRYKKLPGGYVVYSIGPDQTDDGGAESPPTDKTGNRSKSTPRDLTFVVERK